jgi:hypothetical protein
MGRCVVLLTRGCSRMSTEERADGSLRVVYGASIRSCRAWPDAVSNASGTAARPRSRSPRQYAAPSAAHGFCPAALARLEPQSPSTGQYAAHPIATHRDQLLITHRFAPSCGGDPLARPARPLAPLMGAASRSQCRLATTGQVTVKLYGVPAAFALSLGLAAA